MELYDTFPNDLSCTAGYTLELAIKTIVVPDIVRPIDAARKIVSHFCHSAIVTRSLEKSPKQLDIKVRKL